MVEIIIHDVFWFGVISLLIPKQKPIQVKSCMGNFFMKKFLNPSKNKKSILFYWDSDIAFIDCNMEPILNCDFTNEWFDKNKLKVK